MASKANIKLVVLWEDELREAARLLKAYRKEKNAQRKLQLLASAMNAFLVATDGIEDDAALVLSRNPFPRAVAP